MSCRAPCFGRCTAAALAWACATAYAAMPDVAHIQAAYEGARDYAVTTHVGDLVIQTAQCRPLKGNARGAACQIDFVRNLEPDGRLYFDVITVEERQAGQWTLLSGLCLTRPRAGLKSTRAVLAPR